MAEGQSIDVEALVALLRRRRATLPFEIAAFVALELAETCLRDGPGILRPKRVWITTEGMVRVSPEPAANEEASARSIVAVLAHLLIAAGSGVPQHLIDLVEQGPERGDGSLGRLRDELEATLVPLNRSASRRVLARLLREVGRQDVAPALPLPTSGPATLDRDLDALLSSESRAEASAERSRNPGVDPRKADSAPRGLFGPDGEPQAAIDSLLEALEPASTSHESAANAKTPPSHDAPPPSAMGVRTLPELDVPELDPERVSSGKGGILFLVFAGLIAVMLVLVAVFRPDAWARMTGRTPEAPVETAPALPAPPPEAPRFGDLVVRTEPSAQVFLLIGRGPAEARNLPIGVAHEFLVLAEGKSATRAVLPADSEWETTPEGNRYELALQAGDEAVEFEKLDLGPTRLPREASTPSGQLGTVRIVTNPRGAKVYLVIGFGPEVAVSDLPSDRSHELLVFLPGRKPVVATVEPTEFDASKGKPTASLEIALPTSKR